MHMIFELTDEDLQVVDQIIDTTEVERDWGGQSVSGDSLQTIDVHGTLQTAANRVRKYLTLRRAGKSVGEAKTLSARLNK